MSPAQKAAKNVVSPMSRVNDDAQTTRVPVATFIAKINGKNESIVVDFSRRMSVR